MTIEKSSVHYHPGRGVYWQILYFLDEKSSTFRKAIICASEEFLGMKLNKPMTLMDADPRIQQWFEDQTLDTTEKVKNSNDDTLISLFPTTPGMLQAAYSFLEP